MTSALHPATRTLIEEMAQQLVADYLATQAAPVLKIKEARTDPVPFHDLDKAA